MRKLLRKGVPVLAIMMLTMTACSFGSNETINEMDTPPTNYVEENESLELEEEPVEEEPAQDLEENEQGEASVEHVQREIYLLDAGGLVVPQTVEVPKAEGVLKQSLEYLVEEGPVTELLPDGFQAVLPAGTEVDVHLTEDGVAIADFSNEFKNYHPEKEEQILQAITYTLTQFENVEKVQIRINGYDQEMMPVNGTPIGEGVSRANGINIETNSVTDMVGSRGVTLYFLAQRGDNTYYVPVTRRVPIGDEEMSTVAVNELLKGPAFHSELLTDFRQGVELIDKPYYENGVLTLNFNENVLSELQSTAVSTTVQNMLALTLTEQEGIEKVGLRVKGEEILTESGQVATPVSRPSLVNTQSY